MPTEIYASFEKVVLIKFYRQVMKESIHLQPIFPKLKNLGV